MPSTMASALATLLIATRRLATYFMRLPLPNSPTSKTCLPKRLEHRPQPRDRLGVAARIEHEIAVLGLRAGAADRAIDHGVAGFAQHALRFFLI